MTGASTRVVRARPLLTPGFDTRYRVCNWYGRHRDRPAGRRKETRDRTPVGSSCGSADPKHRRPGTPLQARNGRGSRTVAGTYRRKIGIIGTIDLLVNFTVGWVLGYALFGALLPAFLTAGIVYISSSAIITKSLIDRGWIVNDEAQPILGTLVYEDLFIAVYLAVISAVVLGGDGLREAALGVGVALGIILVLFLVAYFGTPLFERLLRTSSHEFTVLRALGVTVLIAGVALTLGVSEAVAAFFAGMAFSSTTYVTDLEELLEPLRDTFATIFFFWIGLITDPLLFVEVLGVIALIVVVTGPPKLLSGFLSGRVYDLDARRSTRVGIALGTRGEFSLIIAAVALAGAGTSLLPEVSQTIYAFTVGYVLVMSVLGSTFMRYSGPLESFAVARFGP